MKVGYYYVASTSIKQNKQTKVTIKKFISLENKKQKYSLG